MNTVQAYRTIGHFGNIFAVKNISGAEKKTIFFLYFIKMKGVSVMTCKLFFNFQNTLFSNPPFPQPNSYSSFYLDQIRF